MTENVATGLQITHTAAQGTLLEGTSRGDGTAEHAKATGFRWGRSLGLWYLPHSRDRAPQQQRIDQLAAALRAAGHTASVRIDATPRDQAEAEAERDERMQTRAARLRHRAERHAALSDSHDQQAHQTLDRIPLGQPILIGNHSERRHRRDLDRAERNMRKAIEHHQEAAEAASHADSAARHMAHRHNPATVARRLDRLAADRRRVQHLLDGTGYYTGAPATGESRRPLQIQADQLDEQIRYWRSIRDQQISDGEAPNYTAADIRTGDQVLYRGTWHVVARVNRTTVSVQTGYSWTDRVPLHEIAGCRRPA